jgi:hypothetical protein
MLGDLDTRMSRRDACPTLRYGWRDACLTLLLVVCILTPLASAGPLEQYNTKYYTIYSDLDEEGVREAQLRMTLLFEEYLKRTRDYAGTPSTQLPFYLFSNQEQYIAASGLPGSSGVYIRSGQNRVLMAIADPRYGESVWSTVQHEAFHQFVDQAIGGNVPQWINEGLAEYFGEGIFTGEEYALGIVPITRLRYVQQMIRSKSHLPFKEIMQLDNRRWNAALQDRDQARANYALAWSFIHYVAHDPKKRYRKDFVRFLADVSDGQDWQKVWAKRLGRNADKIQQRWAEYWLGLPEEAALDSYIEANLRIITNFVARAASMGQSFKTVDEFFVAASTGQIRQPKNQWLPPRLLQAHVRYAQSLGRWNLRLESGRGEITCHTNDGWLARGAFRFSRGKVRDVGVKVETRAGTSADRRR